MIKVGIIEDNVSLLKNLNIFLGNFPDLQIMFSINDSRELDRIERREKLLTPDIVLIDCMHLSDKESLDILPAITTLFPQAKILIYTDHDDETTIVECVMKGATGYLLKSNTLYDIYIAIKECCEFGGFISPKAVLRLISYMQNMPVRNIVQDDLSNKQKEITHCLQQGLTYEDISHQLGITRFTVNYHVQKIFKKMMVNSRVELIYKLNKPELV
jgi:DNA-binding NarL/FixJ family response regulator